MSFLDQVIANTQTNKQENLNNVISLDSVKSKLSENMEQTKNYAGVKSDLFEVEKLQLESPFGGDLKGKHGLFVDESLVNIVSDRYEVHQPFEIVNQFQNAMESHGLEINRVLTNKNNGGLLLSAKFQDCKIVGEKHDANIVFYTSHCGKHKTVMSLDLLRIACFNQVPTLYKNKSRFIISEKHYQNALDLDNISDAITKMPEMIKNYNDKAELLKSSKMGVNDFIELYVEHFKVNKEAKQFNSKVSNLKSTYYNATGQRELENNSAYKAYNAITFDNTHNVRDTAQKEETKYFKNSKDSLEFLDVLVENTY